MSEFQMPQDDPQDQAPQVQMPQQAPPSALGAAVSQMPTLSANSPQEQDASQGFQDSAPSGGSRLLKILGAVASVASGASAGISDKGRPSFFTGMGGAARADIAADQNQQAIKFRSFDDQLRMAELHNQDQKMQLDTQAQQDAHQAAELNMRAIANDQGFDYDTIANHGPAVMDHLAAQSAAGGASVPPGTHISADGNNIYMPKDPDSEKTQAAQKSMYSSLATALGLPGVQPGMSHVPPKWMNMLTNKMNGFALDGSTIKSNELPDILSATQAQRDTLAKSGASDAQLKTLDNMIGIYKANLKNHQDADDAAFLHQKQLEASAPQTPKQQADLQHTQAETAKIKQEMVDAQQAKIPAQPFTDSLGVQVQAPQGGTKEINKRQDSFKKDSDALSKTEGTYQQFQSVLNDINSGKDITGAQSVVALFNAIGLSAKPLQGQGFRINNNTVEEHAQAAGIDQKAVRQFQGLKNGEVITPQQVKDYSTIALQTRHDEYVNKINQARNAGLDPTFLLPRGNGRPIDANTASIFFDASNRNPAAATKVATSLGWKIQ